MYILNERSGTIANSDFVAEFYLMDTSDSTLLSLRWHGVEKPATLERYRKHDEAMDALCQLFQALETDQAAFRMPESLYYFDEHIKKDARTKRRGGS